MTLVLSSLSVKNVLKLWLMILLNFFPFTLQNRHRSIIISNSHFLIFQRYYFEQVDQSINELLSSKFLKLRYAEKLEQIKNELIEKYLLIGWTKYYLGGLGRLELRHFIRSIHPLCYVARRLQINFTLCHFVFLRVVIIYDLYLKFFTLKWKRVWDKTFFKPHFQGFSQTFKRLLVNKIWQRDLRYVDVLLEIFSLVLDFEEQLPELNEMDLELLVFHVKIKYCWCHCWLL